MAEEPDHAAEARLTRSLGLILDSAVEGLRFDAATVTACVGRQMATVAVTDQRLAALDEAQFDSGKGPSLDLLEPHWPICLDDAGEPDRRWQHFTDTASDLGIGSSLSVHLPLDSDTGSGAFKL